MTEDPRDLFERLAGAGVEIVLVGGLAAVALGVPIVTQDVDLCFNPDPENVERLAEALAPFHPRLRIEGMTDDQARTLPFRLDNRTLQRSLILTLQTDVGALDLLASIDGVGAYQEVRAAAVEVEIAGAPLLVLDLPAIIVSKRAAGRPKDFAVLPQIEATLRLRDMARPPTEENA